MSDYYFDSYSFSSIHKEMLSDKNRTLSYKEAILKNPSLFEGKIVLDVGAGTGILSMFAAQAGASKVYAVENSSIVEKMREIVKDNNFQDKIVILQGKIEELTLPEKVDVIISEWMGYCLLYESMLNSVILARDKFMKETGTMFPSSATMRVCGITDRTYYEKKINQWNNVYGYKMSAFRKWALYEPQIEVINSSQIITDECILADFDLNHCSNDDLIIDNKEFHLMCMDDQNLLHGICCFFDVKFEGPEAIVVLSTSPFNPPTHWSQTLFYFDKPTKIEIGTDIIGTFSMKPSPYNYRDQEIHITLKIGDTLVVDQLYMLR